MNYYRVEYTYLIEESTTERKREIEYAFGINCQEAVNEVRWLNQELKELRVERVWKDIHNSWWAVNAWN